MSWKMLFNNPRRLANNPVSVEEYERAKAQVEGGTLSVDAANKLRSSIEVYEFVNKPPNKYMVYISGSKATTWTGEELGTVTFGREYRGNMGDKRVPVRIRAINGFTYSGTFFKSAGDYARVTKVK